MFLPLRLCVPSLRLCVPSASLRPYPKINQGRKDFSPDQNVSSHCSKKGNRERGFSQECEILLSCVIAFKKCTAVRTGVRCQSALTNTVLFSYGNGSRKNIKAICLKPGLLESKNWTSRLVSSVTTIISSESIS